MKRILLPLLLICIAFAAVAEDIKVMSAETLHQRLAQSEQPLVIDVREVSEYEAGHIDGATLVPLAMIGEGLGDVAKDREIVLVCRSGRRSAKAYELLAARGFTRLWNMDGGMLAWERLGYPIAKP